jgi:UDP-2,3-diacylglucosamine hydrolase
VPVNGSPVLFIADLHLSAGRPALRERLERFLRGPARGAGTLYILGDLFEAWIGDDDLGDPFAAGVADSLAALAREGVSIGFTCGNRDFLCGETLAGRAGWQRLADETVIRLDGMATLLLHGDTLCTADTAYQRYRRVMHCRGLQRVLLSLPLSWRRRIARGLRSRSVARRPMSAGSIGDVTALAVEDRLRATGTCWMIHGHTHRPAAHALTVDGQACRRWVLPDWTDTTGGYLEWRTGQEPRLVRFD